MLGHSSSVGLAPAISRQLPALSVLLAALAGSALLGALAALSGEFALLVGSVGLLACLILAYPRFGIWCMCLLLPLAATVLVPRKLLGVTGMNPVNVLVAATVASVGLAWLAATLRQRRFALPPLPQPMIWLYLLPITLAALHGMQSVDLIPNYFIQNRLVAFEDAPGYLRDMYVRPMFLILFCVLVAMVFRDAPNPRRYLVPTLISAGLMCVLVAIAVSLSGLSLASLAVAHARGVLSVVGMHANEISLLLNSALALALFSARGSSGYVRLALAACSVILAATVLFTFSRGGMLGLLVILIAFLLHSKNTRSAIAVMLMAACAVALLPGAVIERASTGVTTGDYGAISAGRADQIWPQVIPVIFDAPLVGGGLKSILWSPPVRSGVLSVAHPHNAYLSLLMDMGLFGFILVMAFFAWAWMQMRRASRDADDSFYQHFFAGASVTLLLLFAQGISDDHFTPTTTQTFLWFSIGAAIGYRQRLALRQPPETPASIAAA